MTMCDYAAIVLMGLAAVGSTASFAIITKYLFDRGLADRNAQMPDLRQIYQAYRTHTRQHAGRVGGALWVHGISAGLFIFIGVIYTVFRFILPWGA